MRILQFVQDDAGQLSATRLAMLITVVAYAIEWMHWTFTQTSPWKPSIEETGTLLAVMGVKALQKFQEVKNNPPTNPTEVQK